MKYVQDGVKTQRWLVIERVRADQWGVFTTVQRAGTTKRDNVAIGEHELRMMLDMIERAKKAPSGACVVDVSQNHLGQFTLTDAE